MTESIVGRRITWRQYKTSRDRRDGRSWDERTGRVWSDSPINGHLWVIPDHRRGGEGHAILVRYRKSGPMQGMHEVVESSAEYSSMSSMRWQGRHW